MRFPGVRGLGSGMPVAVRGPGRGIPHEASPTSFPSRSSRDHLQDPPGLRATQGQPWVPATVSRRGRCGGGMGTATDCCRSGIASEEGFGSGCCHSRTLLGWVYRSGDLRAQRGRRIADVVGAVDGAASDRYGCARRLHGGDAVRVHTTGN